MLKLLLLTLATFAMTKTNAKQRRLLGKGAALLEAAGVLSKEEVQPSPQGQEYELTPEAWIQGEKKKIGRVTALDDIERLKWTILDEVSKLTHGRDNWEDVKKRTGVSKTGVEGLITSSDKDLLEEVLANLTHEVQRRGAKRRLANRLTEMFEAGGLDEYQYQELLRLIEFEA